MTKLLRDIIAFVASRTDINRREDILREINFAWGEIWHSDDLPNSTFEVTVKGDPDNLSRITLPYYVDTIKAAKTNSKVRITLNTPRPYYHDDTWTQSPYTWRILGISPLARSITNASRITLSLLVPATARFTATLIGTSDTASLKREQLVFNIGDTSKTSINSYSDVSDINKDTLIDQDVIISGANSEDFGIIPALQYQSRNTIIQIHDKCNACCANCECWDILYKTIPPVLYYDEQSVPYPEVLMTKTLEWITLPKDGQERKAALWAGKSRELLTGFNSNKGGIAHVLDVGADRLYSYTGSAMEKI